MNNICDDYWNCVKEIISVHDRVLQVSNMIRFKKIAFFPLGLKTGLQIMMQCIQPKIVAPAKEKRDKQETEPVGKYSGALQQAPCTKGDTTHRADSRDRDIKQFLYQFT